MYNVRLCNLNPRDVKIDLIDGLALEQALAYALNIHSNVPIPHIVSVEKGNEVVVELRLDKKMNMPVK